MIAAHRQNRPWRGETVGKAQSDIPSYVPDCYLCPGNTRVSSQCNPDYENTFVFDNDLPCVGMDAPTTLGKPTGIYRNRPATGLARVICYSPLHHLTLAELGHADIVRVIQVWQSQYRELSSRSEINHVLIFENKGDVVGVSNPHPHGQLYATNFVFKTIEIEAAASAQHLAETGRPLFQDIITAEQSDQSRIIAERDTALAFIPYFARYAYEVYLAPKKTHPSIAALSDSEVDDFAAVLKETLVRYDNLWNMSFPYVMVLHQAPTDGGDYRGFHFHIQFHPPLRQPNLLKYLAGPEIGGGCFLSDTSPEQKAAELKSLETVHYKQR
jgi:UDPglucose--hexose-1-phosphate uridylyltransferase